ncbi:MAG TPA: hypothetical protein V6D04_12430, partial [Candidatus Obscuribacterales bacterium]
MMADVDYLQALRNCCRDEAAFVQLQDLLANPHAMQHLRQVTGDSGSQQPLELSSGVLPPATPDPTLDQPAELERLRQAASAEIQELRRLQTVMFHVMEHDLRPFLMGALMVLKNLLNQSGETVAIARTRVERMVQASDRQLSAMNALLETHATPAQTGVPQPEPI